MYPEFRLLTVILLAFIVGIFTYRIVKMQEDRSFIRKAKVTGLEIEIFKDSNDSYFDKYLNEVLYLFKRVEADAIVFEEIDR